ncbi:unnamed protein product [Rotaria socialis]|uniref:G-protein coupled receptors family 1 profile domain-containing protein n=1 Tax=Rotaria socialis TaxID=392032 RepID=A0A817RX47_9BILA|nr:unnamed protein product [Rotaria socialis]
MSDNQTVSFQSTEISWSRPLRFWLLIAFDIPSIICSLFILDHLLSSRTLRHDLHNHTIIILLLLALVFQLTDIPLYLDFILKGRVEPQTPSRCLIWWLVDLGFYNTAAIVLAWASIERHILIFHIQWLSILIFFPPCKQTYDYTLPVCSATPCYLLDPALGIWEMGVHGCLCTLIIAFFNITLLIRVVLHQKRSRRIFHWKKYRKMISQLLLISMLYLLFNLPIMIIWVARNCGLLADVGVEEQFVAFFLTYWVMLLLPMVSLFSLPHLKKNLMRLVCNRKTQQAIVFPLKITPNAAPDVHNTMKHTK